VKKCLWRLAASVLVALCLAPVLTGLSANAIELTLSADSFPPLVTPTDNTPYSSIYSYATWPYTYEMQIRNISTLVYEDVSESYLWADTGWFTANVLKPRYQPYVYNGVSVYPMALSSAPSANNAIKRILNNPYRAYMRMQPIAVAKGYKYTVNITGYSPVIGCFPPGNVTRFVMYGMNSDVGTMEDVFRVNNDDLFGNTNYPAPGPARRIELEFEIVPEENGLLYVVQGVEAFVHPVGSQSVSNNMFALYPFETVTVEAERDEGAWQDEQRSFWDKVLAFLQGIWDAIMAIPHAIANFFRQVWDVLRMIVNWILTVLRLIGRYVQVLTAVITGLPVWISIGALALIAVCVIYVILNRGSGT